MNLFICYRRKDSQHIAGRIYDWLGCAFGPDSVFKDVDSIRLGRNFLPILEAAVTQCDVLLAVIGPRWLEEIDPVTRRPRVDNPEDWVRIEIETALERDIPTIPLLVDETPMPPREALPPCIRGLVDHQGMPVRPDPDFRRDMGRLIEELKEFGEIGEEKRRQLMCREAMARARDAYEEANEELDEDEDDPEMRRLSGEQMEAVRKILDDLIWRE